MNFFKPFEKTTMQDVDKEKISIRLELGELRTICRALSLSDLPDARHLGVRIECFVKRETEKRMKSSLEKIFGKRW